MTICVLLRVKLHSVTCENSFYFLVEINYFIFSVCCCGGIPLNKWKGLALIFMVSNLEITRLYPNIADWKRFGIIIAIPWTESVWCPDKYIVFGGKMSVARPITYTYDVNAFHFTFDNVQFAGICNETLIIPGNWNAFVETLLCFSQAGKFIFSDLLTLTIFPPGVPIVRVFKLYTMI